MLKKSKIVALLVVCVMMFAAVEPAFAKTCGESLGAMAFGGIVGGLLGIVVALLGAFIGLVSGEIAVCLILGGAVLGAMVALNPFDNYLLSFLVGIFSFGEL